MPFSSPIRLVTRKSPLALAQAEYVRQRYLALHPQAQVTLVPMSTLGDEQLDTSLQKIGGKGLFLKELERALMDGQADFAVHSAKDVPSSMSEPLALVATLEREDARDVLVSPHMSHWQQLDHTSAVGTSSLRRQAMLQRLRPGVQCRLARGNVGSRLAKLDGGHYQALLLAGAGLKRLGLAHRITQWLEVEHSLPAIGQGALVIQARRDAEPSLLTSLAALNHAPSALCLAAERAVGAVLGASCQLALGVHARIEGDQLLLQAAFTPDLQQALVWRSLRCKADLTSGLDTARQLGQQLASATGWAEGQAS